MKNAVNVLKPILSLIVITASSSSAPALASNWHGSGMVMHRNNMSFSAHHDGMQQHNAMQRHGTMFNGGQWGHQMNAHRHHGFVLMNHGFSGAFANNFNDSGFAPSEQENTEQFENSRLERQHQILEQQKRISRNSSGNASNSVKTYSW